ncbi:MAG: flagellar protein MotY [Pseudomonadales bacterium]
MPKYVLGTVLLLWMSASLAVTRDLSFAARMDVAHWHVSDSVLECRLAQPLPLYGEAVFSRRAGESLRFFLAARDNPLRAGTAELVSQPPVWAPSHAPKHLGEASVERSKQPITLGEKLASQMMAELLKGMTPRFLHIAWYSAVDPIEVGVSPVYFQDAYKQYLHCVDHLLPHNFDELKHSRVHFATDKTQLLPAATERLDMVASYALADKTVNKIFVDGHTDNVWDSYYNSDLSRRRAKAVVAYLRAKGVDRKMITRRHHGERRPMVPNNNDSNRAKNRRVTVRLAR